MREGLFFLMNNEPECTERTEGVLLEEKACNVSPAEILSVASYVSFALFC